MKVRNKKPDLSHTTVGPELIPFYSHSKEHNMDRHKIKRSKVVTRILLQLKCAEFIVVCVEQIAGVVGVIDGVLSTGVVGELVDVLLVVVVGTIVDVLSTVAM